MNTQTLTLKINGMTCSNCENFLNNLLVGTKGVLSAKADHHSGDLIIEFEPDKIAKEEIMKIVNETHFTVEV